MNICIISPYDYPIPAVKGGAIEQLVNQLCIWNEMDHGFHITVITTYDLDAEKLAKEYKYTDFIYFKNRKADIFLEYIHRGIRKVMKKSGFPHAYKWLEIRKWLQHNKDRFEYIIFEDGISSYIPFLFRQVKPEKVISHLHWIGQPSRTLNKYYSVLFAVSEYIRTYWVGQTGYTGEQFVLKNGIDLKKFDKRVEAEIVKIERNKLGISQTDFVVIYVGRIIQEKGIIELIDAVERMNDRDIALIIVGSSKFGIYTSSDYEIRVNKKIEECKIKIIQTGFLPNEELNRYYKIADVQVIPSIVDEAAGLVALEGMASGLPLIISDSGGLPEYALKDASIMVHRGDGIREEISNALIKLKNNPELRKEMSLIATKKAKDFSSERMYQEFKTILYNLRNRDG